MYNGIGLTTPRGSGTSGYVVRNLSHLRTQDPNQDRNSAWDAPPPKHREPDEGILEHERKRKVEVKCMELRVALEDEEIPEDEIEKQVDALREKLLANVHNLGLAKKPTDTHAMAAAKKQELAKMARAFGTRTDYQDGDAFNREKQEELKQKRLAERDTRREDDRKRMAEQKYKWAEEKRERDRARRFDDARKDKGGGMGPPSSIPRRGDRDDYRRRSRSPRRSPPPRSGRDHSPPSRRRASLSRSRSRSPVRRRSPARSRSRSPVRRRRSSSRSASPRMRSRSPRRAPRDSARGRSTSRPRRPRSRSASTGSSMSVSSSGSKRSSRD